MAEDGPVHISHEHWTFEFDDGLTVFVRRHCTHGQCQYLVVCSSPTATFSRTFTGDDITPEHAADLAALAWSDLADLSP